MYCRTSTIEQTIEHQLMQAIQAGFEIDEIVSDPGSSGVTTKLEDRPQGRRLFDKLRSGDTLVVRWVDRLGRNYADTTNVIREFMAIGVTVRTVINSMTFDGSTKDPIQMAVRDAIIGFMAASAQSQAEVSKEAQRAGIAAARQDVTKYLGRRPSFSRDLLEEAKTLISNGLGDSEIAKRIGLSRQTVRRIRTNPAGSESALDRWGL